jgi:sugar/nucleoside kinase (ribokinase family)
MGGQTYFLPAQSVDVYNAVGAGDIFGAGFIYGYRRGCLIEACLAFGNSAAALYVSKDNDRYPDINDVANIVKLYKAFSSNLIKGEV